MSKRKTGTGSGKFRCKCGSKNFSEPSTNGKKNYIKCLVCGKKIPYRAGVKINELDSPRGFKVRTI